MRAKGQNVISKPDMVNEIGGGVTRVCYNVTESVNEDGVAVFDYEYVDVKSGKDVLASVKELVCGEIADHDTSDAVNGFYVNGEHVWLDKATRVGIKSALDDYERMGIASYTFWFGNRMVEMPISVAHDVMAKIELYASECFNVTSAHKVHVSKTADVESALMYDYSVGYPEKVSITI